MTRFAVVEIMVDWGGKEPLNKQTVQVQIQPRPPTTQRSRPPSCYPIANASLKYDRGVRKQPQTASSTSANAHSTFTLQIPPLQLLERTQENPG
ncbi:hypothetical protein FS837_004591, partial [Tulasnella sp. UAMH 9824]